MKFVGKGIEAIFIDRHGWIVIVWSDDNRKNIWTQTIKALT